MEWKIISLLLCGFGFLKEFRPSESFVTDYFTGPWKNLTQVEVNQEIYPVGTYSTLGTLIVALLLTDIVKYKPAIILCGFSGAATFFVMRYGNSLFHMQIVEFLYGTFISTEVAYFTYIYAKVDKQHYEKVTGNTRVAFLLGRFTAGTIAQLTTSLNILDYEQLIYISMISLSIATCWACFLPPVKQSTYFHSRPDQRCTSSSIQSQSREEFTTTEANNRKDALMIKIRHAIQLLWNHFLDSYKNAQVFKWSIWWAFATCGFLQILNYTQLLWQTAVDQNIPIYNGAVEALYTVISAIVVYFVGMLHLNWPLVGEGTLAIFSLMQGGLLIASHFCYNIWILYILYIAFGVIYHSIITIASFVIAKYLSDDCYALIFGINTFFALVFQSILTLITVSKHGLELDIRNQYFAYGLYFLFLGFGFVVISIHTLWKYKREKKPMNIWIREEDTTDEVDNSNSQL